MTIDTTEPEAAARGTLALLETRLRRLEFLLRGNIDENGPRAETATTTSGGSHETLWAKMDALEAELVKLKKLAGTSGAVVRDIERLASAHPDLFSSPAESTSDVPKSEDLSTLASIVLAHATLYPETSSRLSSLQTLQVPPAEQSSHLVSLIPRLDQLDEEDRRMQEEARALRERSARCLEWWVKIGVIGMGDMWEDWETRIADVQRHLVRWERRGKEEQGYL